jgi:hypothetical protein
MSTITTKDGIQIYFKDWAQKRALGHPDARLHRKGYRDYSGPANAQAQLAAGHR